MNGDAELVAMTALQRRQWDDFTNGPTLPGREYTANLTERKQSVSRMETATLAPFYPPAGNSAQLGEKERLEK